MIESLSWSHLLAFNKLMHIIEVVIIRGSGKEAQTTHEYILNSIKKLRA